MNVSFARAFKDNYIWLIHGADRNVVVVDPGDAGPVLDLLDARGWTPQAVFVTHHHPDHAGGAGTLASRYDIQVYGPAREAQAVVTQPLKEGDRVELPGLPAFRVLDVPGHTAGHIAFFGGNAVFCGDTLFSAGCGKLFEGTPQELLASLEKLASLPGPTEVYCGHEYTEANLAFGATVEPDNPEIQAYREECRQRPDGRPTLPSSIARELKVNVFLRTHVEAVKQAASDWSKSQSDDNVAIFAALRRWKDSF